MTENFFKKSGFTLVELLVVIAIIGLLASVTVVAVNGARAKARDAKRHTDIKAIQTALQQYYEANGRYPASGGSIIPGRSEWTLSNDSSWASLQTALAPYMARVPIDPAQTAGWLFTGSHAYAYNARFQDWFSQCGNGQGYVILYRLEIAKDPDPGTKTCAAGPVLRWGDAEPDPITTFMKTVGNRQNN
ncbi:MAG: hypothetical protein A3J48_02240 [Candidatus Doudnabacteria bacterium RIFCSPHIGHO2_02_FULL_46_11]|uniref:Type II secretion system protein GspG C-terminal domain-containing protein n=1 Tax=Candidatus Doudnabacteria bacterium RIFCSPHIGHO2_02_FULL_46_11 TaxID=1817832 RepID=A0A1F5P8D4_9BACT|nr:MAG: hypothetical protein A3J48_02240 [Candidatus Doudnabacteria bacterium RIFCSPHIGHO2_02_FULL_46_11]